MRKRPRLNQVRQLAQARQGVVKLNRFAIGFFNGENERSLPSARPMPFGLLPPEARNLVPKESHHAFAPKLDPPFGVYQDSQSQVAIRPDGQRQSHQGQQRTPYQEMKMVPLSHNDQHDSQ